MKKIGQVVGTWGSIPYIHLQLEAWQRFQPDIPVLIHDDCSKEQERLAELCKGYGADFHSTKIRLGHQWTFYGDVNLLAFALEWADRKECDLLAKFSTRWLPLMPWAKDLSDLADNSGHLTFSNCAPHCGLGFVTNCFAMSVKEWLAADCPWKIRRAIDNNETGHPESYVHCLARLVHALNKNKKSAAWDIANPKPEDHDAYASWEFNHEGSYKWGIGRIWKDFATPHDYWCLSKSWGLPYTEEDFKRDERPITNLTPEVISRSPGSCYWLGEEDVQEPNLRGPEPSSDILRFHLLGLAHLPCTKRYLPCAFTQKNYKLSQMLLSLGHEVIYYGSEGSDVPCSEFVQTHTLADIRASWGEKDRSEELGYDWTDGFRVDWNDAEPKPATRKQHATCVGELLKRKRPNDFLLLSMGWNQKSVAEKVGIKRTCEPGVGYQGAWAPYRAYESSAIMHAVYRKEEPDGNGRSLDRIIPNYFDPNDLKFSHKAKDYYLYLGRLTHRKGVSTAVDTCNKLGARLLIAGQGGKVENGFLRSSELNIQPGTWEYLGAVGVGERKELLSGALAVFCPSQYLEPFCGVHVEAMLSGSPAITTDFGVFPETVINGVNGYRCHTPDDFVIAAVDACNLVREEVQKSATRFLMANVRWLYEKWFRDLLKWVR